MADSKISNLPAATTPLAGTEALPIVQGDTTKKIATDDLTIKNLRSNTTTGILQVAGPAAASTRVMTVPDANFSAARTDAAQTFAGNNIFSGSNTSFNSGVGVLTTTLEATGVYHQYYKDTSATFVGAIGTTVPGSGVAQSAIVFSSYDGSWNQRLAVNSAGNVVLNTGAGIDFSATANGSGTMTSELLNDYEEGTWTPVIRGAGAAGTYEQVVTRATYTKIGRQVTLQCYIVLASLVTGGGTSYLQITGAPFTAISPNQFAAAILLTDMVKSATTLYVGVSWANTTTLYLPEIQPTAFADFPVANAVANKTIQFTVTYFV